MLRHLCTSSGARANEVQYCLRARALAGLLHSRVSCLDSCRKTCNVFAFQHDPLDGARALHQTPHESQPLEPTFCLYVVIFLWCHVQ